MKECEGQRATIAIHYSCLAAKAEEVCEQIRSLRQQAILVQVDSTDREAIIRKRTFWGKVTHSVFKHLKLCNSREIPSWHSF